MIAVESASVPSQSKTRAGTGAAPVNPASLAASRVRRARDEPARSRRQRRLDDDRRAVDRDARTRCGARAGTSASVPASASALFHAKSPYLSSPASGKPRCVRCTRIWCVRPVSARLRAARPAARAAATSLDAAEYGLRAARPRVVHAHAPLAFAGHEASRAASSTAPHRVAPLAAHQHEVALVDAALAQLRMQPDQRRALLGDAAARRRCRGRAGGRARGSSRRAAPARSRSITPKLMPLPPCTARPDGLSSAISARPRTGSAARDRRGALPRAAGGRRGADRRHAQHVAGGEARVGADARAC